MNKNSFNNLWNPGFILGIAIGVAIGISLKNLAIGIGVGVALALAFSKGYRKKNQAIKNKLVRK